MGGPYGSYFQSERKPIYKELVEGLIREGKAYRCYCTKEELDRQREELKARNPKAAFVYPGTCRDRTDQPDLPYVVRFKTPRDGSTEFVDKVFGAISTPERGAAGFRAGPHRRLPALQPRGDHRRPFDGHHAGGARA